MGQTFTVPASAQTANTALGTNTPTCLETLRSTFSGTTAPSSPTPVEGQLFCKTDTNEIQCYDGATWRTIAYYTASVTSVAILKDGTITFTANQPMGGFILTGLGAGSANGHSLRYEDMTRMEKLTASSCVVFQQLVAGSINFPIWTAPFGCTILGGYISVIPVAYGNLASDAANYYTFKMRNTGTGGAGTTDIGSSITNNGVTLTLNQPYSIGTVSSSVSTGEAISIRVEINGAPTAMHLGYITMTIYYKNS
jgi:hypothetical protein